MRAAAKTPATPPTAEPRLDAIAARERELAELQRRLESGRPPMRARLDDLRPKRGDRRDQVDEEALAARERAALERAQALAGRERAAEAREQAAAAQAAELAAESERIAARERELQAELASARAKLTETDAERKLAQAERDRLE